MKAKEIKIPFKAVYLLLILVFAAAAVVAPAAVYFTNRKVTEADSKAYVMETEAVGAQIESDVADGMLVVSGYLTDDRQPEMSSDVTVVLRDTRDGGCYEIPTTAHAQDPSEFGSDSARCRKVYACAYAKDLPAAGELEILLSYSREGQLYLFDTGKTISVTSNGGAGN